MKRTKSQPGNGGIANMQSGIEMPKETVDGERPPALNRTYKSTIFVMIFADKKNLLELYNAISGKHYEDPELLEINTLENAIYMTVKNDVSFIIDARLSLYEHQSTYSPNLPLRFLLYIASEYSGMTADENLYGTRTVLIPSPKFVIFYNGEQEQPERKILKLSDMYQRSGSAEEGEDAEPVSLELRALMLNINKGHNEKLKEACKTLKDYAEYTDRVRRYSKEMSLEEAVERAITECIQEGILREFLLKNRAEAKMMSIFEYDQEKHMRQEREQAYEEGWDAGQKAGEEAGKEDLLYFQIQRKLAKGKEIPEIAEALETDEETVRQLIEQRKEQNLGES